MRTPWIITQLTESSSRPEQLLHFSTEKWSKVLFFAIFWLAVSGLLVAAQLNRTVLPEAVTATVNAARSASQMFPSDTSLYVTDGKLRCTEDRVLAASISARTLGAPETAIATDSAVPVCDTTFTLPLPELFTTQQTLSSASAPESVVLLSTSASSAAQIAQGRSSQPLAVINEDTLFLAQAGGSYDSLLLSELSIPAEASLSSHSLEQLSKAIEPWVAANRTALFMLIVLATVPIVVVSRVTQIFWDTLILFGLSRLYGWKMSFGQTFKLSLGVGVLAALLDAVALLLYGKLPVPLFTIAFWALYLIVFFMLKKQETGKSTK